MRWAQVAMPVLLRRGNIKLAAEIFHAHLSRAKELELSRDDLLSVAGQLRQIKLINSSARAYAMIIQEDAWETKAIKGLLQVAETQLQQQGSPDDAKKIYEFLLENCSASPLADFMRQGLQEAERRTAVNE